MNTFTGHILKGYVKVNDSYFTTDTYNNDVARRHVLCQEVGHEIGLDHVKGPKKKSCMNDQFGLFSASFQSPNAHDLAMLVEVYCHLDNSCDSGSDGGGGKGNGKKPKNVMVRPLPNGVTQIAWVVPAST
ncbi:MAG: hypothetical protein ACE5KX_00865 [Acidimicrobiia bacterium]